MRALIFADLHAHNFREFSELREGINSRLAEQLLCIDRITVKAAEKKADLVLFLGDLFHLKNSLDSKVIQLVSAKMKQLAHAAPAGLWFVPGNHDYIKWDKDAAILEVLEELGSGQICLFPEMSQVSIEEWQIIIAPYSRRPETTDQALRTMAIQENSIFLGHQDLMGQKYGCTPVAKGLDPDLLASKFRWSFVGHFHDSKLVRPNVISVGAPLQLSFGAMAEKTGYWLLDTKLAQPLQFVENRESPTFTEMVLAPGQEVDFTDEKNYYRIKVKGALMPEGVERLKWHRLSFEGVRDSLSKERSDIKFSDSAEVLIEKYIKARNISNLDEERLKVVGRKYLP